MSLPTLFTGENISKIQRLKRFCYAYTGAEKNQREQIGVFDVFFEIKSTTVHHRCFLFRFKFHKNVTEGTKRYALCFTVVNVGLLRKETRRVLKKTHFRLGKSVEFNVPRTSSAREKKILSDLDKTSYYVRHCDANAFFDYPTVCLSFGFKNVINLRIQTRR